MWCKGGGSWWDLDHLLLAGNIDNPVEFRELLMVREAKEV